MKKVTFEDLLRVYNDGELIRVFVDYEYICECMITNATDILSQYHNLIVSQIETGFFTEADIPAVYTRIFLTTKGD